MEELVLASAEAAGVVISEATADLSFKEIAERFEDGAELDVDALKLALRRALTFDAVMQRIGNCHSAVTDTVARIFYELHSERFLEAVRLRV